MAITQDQQIPECVRDYITKKLDDIFQHAILPANRKGLSLNISIPDDVNELVVQHFTLYWCHKGYEKGLGAMTTEERSKLQTDKKKSAEHRANISKGLTCYNQSAEHRSNSLTREEREAVNAKISKALCVTSRREEITKEVIKL